MKPQLFIVLSDCYKYINTEFYSSASSFAAIKASLRSNSELLKVNLTPRAVKILVLAVFLIQSSG